jgi:NADPH:quinone reductase-like Zn-dependent oxidoreductase
MKAVVWTKSGPPDVLQLQEVAKPFPKDNQVLIKIHAATVSAGDCDLRRSKDPVTLWFLRLMQPGPIIIGQELAGEIETIGKRVTRFRQGDQVVAWSSFRLGAYAEYTCLSEKAVMAIKPSNMTYEEAAPLAVGGLDATYFIQKGHVQSGQRVLINGAGGSIGTFAVQLADYFGAEVTGVDSTEKLDMLRSIGADHVIDYTMEDFAKSNESYDVIFDVIGTCSFSRSVEMLTPTGRLLLANSRPRGDQKLRLSSGKRVIPWKLRSADEYAKDFLFLRDLIEAKSVKSVIDKGFPLEQIAEAHRYVETRKKRGHVVITVGPSS